MEFQFTCTKNWVIAGNIRCQNTVLLFFCRPWTEEEDEMLKEVVESVRVGNRISFAQGMNVFV